MSIVFITFADPILSCQDTWTISCFAKIRRQYAKLKLPKTGNIIIEGSAITQLDTAGAWLLKNIETQLTKQGLTVTWQNLSETHQKLLTLVTEKALLEKDFPSIPKQSWLADIGKATVAEFDEFVGYLAFVGKVAMESMRVFRNIHSVRWNALANVLYRTGVQALPIIALLSFMIGVVISYQMGNQLRNYGANVFIVDLLGLSVLREFGPLLCAIMVAGRTGSAFTAQLGTMKLYQEVDALNTMGVTPEELLLIPRLVGLFIALPLLTIWSDCFGILGGMVMANNMLDISWYEFLQRFQHEIPVRALLIGLGKAPVYAMLIGSIGCFQGMLVKGSAESVGKLTTRSVVLSIFSIILADAVFSIIFSKFKL